MSIGKHQNFDKFHAELIDGASSDFPVYGDDAKALARLDRNPTSPESAPLRPREVTTSFGAIGVNGAVEAMKFNHEGRHLMTPTQVEESLQSKKTTAKREHPAHRMGA